MFTVTFAHATSAVRSRYSTVSTLPPLPLLPRSAADRPSPFVFLPARGILLWTCVGSCYRRIFYPITHDYCCNNATRCIPFICWLPLRLLVCLICRLYACARSPVSFALRYPTVYTAVRSLPVVWFWYAAFGCCHHVEHGAAPSSFLARPRYCWFMDIFFYHCA